MKRADCSLDQRVSSRRSLRPGSMTPIGISSSPGRLIFNSCEKSVTPVLVAIRRPVLGRRDDHHAEAEIAKHRRTLGGDRRRRHPHTTIGTRQLAGGRDRVLAVADVLRETLRLLCERGGRRVERNLRLRHDLARGQHRVEWCGDGGVDTVRGQDLGRDRHRRAHEVDELAVHGELVDGRGRVDGERGARAGYRRWRRDGGDDGDVQRAEIALGLEALGVGGRRGRLTVDEREHLADHTSALADVDDDRIQARRSVAAELCRCG